MRSRHFYAGHHSARKQVPSELVPSQQRYSVLMSVELLFDASSAVHFRSSSHLALDASSDAVSIDAHHLRLFTPAARCSLEPGPATRFREAKQLPSHMEHHLSVFVAHRCFSTYPTVRRYLDMAPMGIIIPMVDTKEQIDTLEAAAFLPPRGRRGPGGPAVEQVSDLTRNGWAELEEQLVFLPQIETRKGMRKLQLFDRDWITGGFVGPYDLMMDLGLPMEEFCAPGSEHEKAILTICEGLRKMGKYCGITSPNGEDARRWIDYGFRVIVCGEATRMIGQQAEMNIRAIRRG